MNTRIVNALTASVALMVLLIGAGAFILSYDALYATGAVHGIPTGKAWIWPLLIDGPLVVFTLALLAAQLTRQGIKLWAGLVITYTLATVGFNLSHAQPSPLGWTVAIVAPVGLLLTTEALRHLAKTIIEHAAPVQTLAELTQQVDQRAADLDRLSGQIERATAHLDALKSEAKGQMNGNLNQANEARLAKIEQRRVEVLTLAQQGMTPAIIADQLNVSLSTVKRDLTQLNGKVKSEGA